jgi:hypothetical protein
MKSRVAPSPTTTPSSSADAIPDRTPCPANPVGWGVLFDRDKGQRTRDKSSSPLLITCPSSPVPVPNLNTMKNYIPTPDLHRWTAFHQTILHQTIPPSLHDPRMWNDLRQALHEGMQQLRRRSRLFRQCLAHRNFRARMKARRNGQ